MEQYAKGGTLRALVKLAMPLCKEAQRHCPRTGPGKPTTIPDWVLAVLIMIAVLKRTKTKSAQYRFLDNRRREPRTWLGIPIKQFPARSTAMAGSWLRGTPIRRF
jgi:hypothetical protein